MNVNSGIAGAWPGTDVIYRTRADAERDAARSIGISTAGLPPGTVIAERGPARATDGDAVFKVALAKAYSTPHGLEKSEPVVVETKPEPTRKLSEAEAITGPVSVTDMIKAAQAQPGAIEDLERGYSGREIAAIAKAAAAQLRRVTNADLDKVSLPLRKAIAVLDGMVADTVARILAK